MKRMFYILSGKGAKGIIREKDEKWCLKRKKDKKQSKYRVKNWTERTFSYHFSCV